MPSQLFDEIADLTAIAGELDRGPRRAAVQDLRPALDQVGQVGGGDARDHQLAAVYVVSGQVFDLDHLDEALELLAHLVDLGVAGVDSEGHAEQAALAARAARHCAPAKSTAAR